jgi:hypothetical protein
METNTAHLEHTKEKAGGPLSSYVLLAVVDEIRREMPRYGPPSATAKVMLFDGTGGQTCVEIPVISIVNQLDHVSRYLVEIKFRPMAPGERFDPANVKRLASADENLNNHAK